MKSLNHLILALSLLLGTSLFLTGCDEEGGNDEIEESPVLEEVPKNTAVSTWDGHSLRVEADRESKWVASISFGEELELLGETKDDPNGKYTYEKVRLLDGKEGWVRDDLIFSGGRHGVAIEDAEIYQRPSVTNISTKLVRKGTQVVIKQVSEEFQEFIGINDKSNNRSRGWVLGNSVISVDENDIAVAVLMDKAMKEANPNKRRRQLQMILENTSFENSVLYDMVNQEVGGGGNGEDMELGPDQIRITGNNVNVRNIGSTEGSSVVFQVGNGDVVGIVEVGNMEEIGGHSDYWYKIETDEGKTGWIFGQFTSAAQ